MNVIAQAIQIAELALWACIFWFVCNFIGMPDAPKRACQMLIVFIAIMASLQIVLSSSPTLSYPSTRLLTTPSIIAPERH